MQTRRPVIGRRWGSLDGVPLLYGGRHYRLVVYPPGTDDRERRLLQAWQALPPGVPFLGLVTFAVLAGRLGLAEALALTAVLVLGPLAWLRQALRRRRRDVCVVHAEYLYGAGTAAELDRCKRVVSLSSTLTDAERALDRGELTPVDFQRIWGDVHAEARALRAAPHAA